MFWSAGCEDCSLTVLLTGLGINFLQFWSNKYEFFSISKILQVLVIKSLDPDVVRVIETNADLQDHNSAFAWGFHSSVPVRLVPHH